MTLNYLKGCGLAMFGGFVTIREVLTTGSLFITCGGGLLALAGGWWAYQSKRLEYRTREVELRIRQKQLAHMEMTAKDAAREGRNP